MVTISHRNGEVSEKADSGCRFDGFRRPGKGGLGAGGTIWEKICARRALLEANGCIFVTVGRPKSLFRLNSLAVSMDGIERGADQRP